MPRVTFLDGEPPRNVLRLEELFVGDSGGLGRDPRPTPEPGDVKRLSKGGHVFRPSREGRRSVPGGDWVCICAWDLEGDLDGECARPWTSTGTCICEWSANFFVPWMCGIPVHVTGAWEQPY